MRFVNNVRSIMGGKTFENVNVKLAILDADEILMPYSPMIAEVALKKDWQYDVLSGEYVAVTLTQMPKTPVSVEIYYPRYKFSAQTCAWDGKRIGINGYWLQSADHLELVGGIAHEWCHKQGFHHIDKGWWGARRANFWTKNKSLYSVPYYISDNIGRWIKA